jgi:hypothetical protein
MRKTTLVLVTTKSNCKSIFAHFSLVFCDVYIFFTVGCNIKRPQILILSAIHLLIRVHLRFEHRLIYINFFITAYEIFFKAVYFTFCLLFRFYKIFTGALQIVIIFKDIICICTCIKSNMV